MFKVLVVLFILGCGMKMQQIADKENYSKEQDYV